MGTNKNIKLTGKNARFLDYAVEKELYSGVSTKTGVVNYAIDQLRKNEKFEVEMEVEP